MEKWKDIPGYEGLYGITSCGRVWSYRSKKFLKPRKTGKGYLRVCLSVKGDKKEFYTHQLVAKTYIPNSHSNNIQFLFLIKN